MKRRQFIEKGVLGGAALTLLSSTTCSKKQKQKDTYIPRRELGKTAEMLSIIGFGGIIIMNEQQQDANSAVAKAFDSGVNYFDVAPSYGNAEDKLGPALKPYRNKCFLACKTTERKKEKAEQELNESLKKMQTDHFDLYQLHALSSIDDVELAFGQGGAMEVFLNARQEGKIRFIGFSAHSEEAALLAMEKFEFDTMLIPVNFVCWYQGNFGQKMVKLAKQKNMGILALKALAYTTLKKDEKKPYPKCWYRPIDDEELMSLALRFTLSQGTTAAIPPGEGHFFWKALERAGNYSPLSPQEKERLIEHSLGIEPLFKNV